MTDESPLFGVEPSTYKAWLGNKPTPPLTAEFLIACMERMASQPTLEPVAVHDSSGRLIGWVSRAVR